MWRRFSSLILPLALLALAACAAEEKVTPAPGTPMAETRPAWEQEWERVLAAAKQEGKLTILGPVGTPAREGLAEPFQKKYGISVELLGMSSAEAATKLQTERTAGQYLWDIMVHGTSPGVLLTAQGLYDPIKPALVLPEVKEPKNWVDGRLEFADSAETYNLAFLDVPALMLVYNKNLVAPDELKSYRDLLNPKWKGKIAANDPKIAGVGQSAFTFFYAKYGEDFVRDLAKQELALSRDVRQVIEWVAQGRTAISIGNNVDFVKEFLGQGTPIAVIDTLEGKGFVSVGWGSLFLINRAPHPNAAKLYINWLLSKEGQTELAKSQGYASRRVDIPNKDWTAAELLPDLRFWNAYTEEGIEVREKLLPLLRDVLGQ